jgi:hypothetical protein
VLLPGHFTPRKETCYPLNRRLGGPHTSLCGCRRSCPTRIWSSDHPARSESLYWLRYPAPHFARRYGKLKDCNIYLWLKSSFRERNNRVTKLHVVLDFENVKWFCGRHVNEILFTPIGKDQPSMCLFPQNSEVLNGVCYVEFCRNGTVNVGSTSTNSFMTFSKVQLSLIRFSQSILLVGDVTWLDFICVVWKCWKYWKKCHLCPYYLVLGLSVSKISDTGWQ